MLVAFSLATYRERQSKIRARLEKANLDAAVITAPDNINYLTGFDSLGYLWYQALILYRRTEPPFFLTRTSEQPCVQELSAIERASFYDIATQDPVELVARALTEAGVAQGRIGVELQSFSFSPAQYERLRQLLPKASLIDLSTLIADERLIRSPEEIAYQRSAARMADSAMRAAFAFIRPGVSEIDVAGVMARALGEAGSEYAAISPIVATGRRSSMTHAMPQRQVICAGDVVVLELAGVCNRYHAVLMRTAVVGRPTQRVREVADLQIEGFKAAIEAAKPGAAVGGANTICNQILNRLDLARNRVHRIGYSLGIAYPPSWLEAMIVDEADPHVFEPNMTFTIEPNLSLYEEGFGLKLGDTVLCTTQGSESLSELPPELQVLG
jgi:Xaa-Pro dipeptidase